MTVAEMQAFAATRANLLTGPGRPGYYADAAFRMTPVAAEGLGTWAVDASWRCYVDPEYLPGGAAGWTVHQCADVLEHEVNHLLRDHATRMTAIGARGANSNIATDAEINDDLRDDSFVRGEQFVHPARYGWPEGLTAEEYYALAEGKDADADDGGEPGDASGSDAGSDGACGSSPAPEGDEEAAPPSGGGSTEPTDDVPQHRCGSGAGAPIEGELDADDATAPALSEAEQGIARRATAEAVQQYERTHGQGSVPAGLARWAADTLAPSAVPWQRVLAGLARRALAKTAGNTDYSYARRSRRGHATPRVILPGVYAPKPKVAVVVDTSGSMSSDDITAAVSEVHGIARKAGCTREELSVIAVDAAAAAPIAYNGPQSLTLTGGGGTDMRVGIDAGVGLGADVVVVLTDGFTPWPAQQPRNTTVIVGLIGADEYVGEQTRSSMPWARVLNVSAA